MDAFAFRALGCQSSVLGVLALLAAGPAFVLSLFALGFNDNGSPEGYATGTGLLGASQWLLYGGVALLLGGMVLCVLPWFRPEPPPTPLNQDRAGQDTSPLP